LSTASSSSSTYSQQSSSYMSLDVSDLQVPTINVEQPECLEDALNVINDLTDFVRRTSDDLQAQRAYTVAEREGRRCAERKLDAETIKLNRTAQTLVLAEGTIRSLQESQRRLNLRHQDLCKTVEKSVSTLLDKMQLADSNDYDGQVTISVNMEEAIQFEELLLLLRERIENGSKKISSGENEYTKKKREISREEE